MTGVGNVETRFFEFASPADPFVLELGDKLEGVRIAYETYGTLNEDRSNAILLFHALTGSAHAAGINRYENFPTDTALDPAIWTSHCHEGWWDRFIGAGRPFDTDRYFIICANYIGGCYGSTGPASIDPRTGRPYGARFPDVTIRDIVRSQVTLLDHLGIDQLLAAIGGSMGGMLAMDLALRYPDRVRVVIPMATGVSASILTKVHNFEQLYAINEDANFNAGDYYEGPLPQKGLALARMIGHKTFVSLDVIENRARDEIIQPENNLKGYRMLHQIESYMLHQGATFARRFDANSYVKILNAWQRFNLAASHGDDDLVAAFHKSSDHRYLVISIDSDVCFYPEEQARIANALKAAGIEYRYITVHSDKGHDSFLIEPDLYAPSLIYILAEGMKMRA